MLNRRTFLSGTALAALAAALPVRLPTARAEAAAAARQAPAFQRLAVGDTLVTAVCDGSLELSPAVMQGIDEAGFAAALDAAFLPSGGYVAPVNAYVIERGGRTILVDAGGTSQMAPTLGELDDNLAAAGIDAGSIDTILITHLHLDHIGHLLAADGSVAFPNAEMMLRAEEAAFWTDPATRAALPEDFRPMFDIASAVIEAYGDRVTRFDSDREVAPGIRSVFLPGHTPGHTGYRVEDGDAALLVWGDIIHVAPVQFPDPAVALIFDTDPDLARTTRRAILDAVAADRLMVTGMHMPFPGFSHIARDGDGFRAVPAGWQYQL
jgi:glyoxylase-like metal-dependent hydrolase (beta-lactamase superfamily II)